ncbi:MAG TPA: cache domain-containing protein, partial [Aquabacterium sp.]|nr:cache domain-containing protein [Aquabacterium sp.]
MIDLLRRISIDNKLRLLSLVPLMLLLVVSGFMVWRLYDESVEDRKVATRQTVEAACAIVDWAHSLETSGEVSRDKAQQMALQALNRARYSGSEYFWVNDMSHKMLMHPTKPELNGKDLSDMTDPDGTKVFVQFVDTVHKNKSGFVSYRWPKPEQQEPVAKISYVTGFEPWGWVIGSGVYVDDLKAEFMQHLGQLALLLAAAIAVSVFIGRLVGRIITRGVAKAVKVADAISEGDISQDIDVKGSDEIAHLLDAMRKMSGHLTLTMREVREAADSLSQASKEIASGNGDLSSRTEQTAASLQQTAASMDQLTSSVRQSAESAYQANRYVDSAAGVAVHGGDVVSQVVTTMDGINHASKKISDIIGVIDGIAFQT